MKTRSVAAAVLSVVLLAACGGGSDVGDLREPGETSAAGRDDAAVRTPDVDAAPEGGVNRPREGTYTYTYESRQTNASTPDAAPRRSKANATYTSKVSRDGDVYTFADSSSEGPAVATRKQRWEDDRVLEVSSEITTDDQQAGCTYSEPIEVLRIPLKEEKFPPQELEGSGTNCNGTRTLAVEGREDVLDDAGLTWSTWRITSETVIKTDVGLTQRSTDTRWFSPDLGKDVKLEGTTEYIDPDGKVTVRAEQSVLLTSFPDA